MNIPVKAMTEKEIQRLIYLAHRDLCRVEGAVLLAREKLEAEGNLSGNQRKQAVMTIKAGPEQAEVLEGALAALRGSLREARSAGMVG